ncbi:uroporphyrinogen-III C-methyltransferase [Oligella ureolytica]
MRFGYGVGVVLVAAAVAGIYYSNQSDDSANNPSAASQSVAEVETAQTETAETELLNNNIPAATDEAEEGQSLNSVEPNEDSADNESSTDLASSDDVVEHQSGEEAVGEEQDSDTATNSMPEEGSSSVEERPAELSAIVSPELGIGAFEQEELATGEKAPEEVTTMDEANAEVVDGSEVEEIESDTLINTPSADDVTPEENNAFTDDSAVEPNQESTELESAVTTQELEAEALERLLETQTQQQIQAQVQAIAAVEEQGSQVIAELEREFEVLAARQQQEIRRLQQELSGMQQHLQASNASADNLLLNDVSRLLQSAENELRFNGSVANAVSILTVAQRIAAESKNKMLEGLVGAIGADIVSLKSSESATVENMFRQVQQLSRLIEVAPLNTPDYASHNHLMMPGEATTGTSTNSDSDATTSETQTATTDADARWYERTWTQTKSFANTAYDAIASDLGDLVRVEKLSDPDSGLLSAEQAGIMRNNLKMQLGFAQQALMSRQQGIWQTSLTAVAESLKQYFRQDSKETIQAQSMLAELVASSVQPTMPDISHSRRALSETYEQLRVQRSFQE